MRRHLIALMVALSTLLVVPTGAFALAPGDADPTFAPFNAFVNSDGSGTEPVEALAATETGKQALVATYTGFSAGLRVEVNRFGGAGGFDTAFGNALTGPGYALALNNSEITDLVPLADGRLLFVGSAANELIVGRLTANGTLDTTFANDASTPGIRVIARSAGATFFLGRELVRLTDGSILAAGEMRYPSLDYQIGVAHLTADGAIDSAFDASPNHIKLGGTVGAIDDIFAFVALADNTALLVGATRATDDTLLIGVRASGAVGQAVVDASGTNSDNSARGAVALGDNTAMLSIKTAAAPVLMKVKINPAGSPVPQVDTSFGTLGYARPASAIPANSGAIERDRMGRFLLLQTTFAAQPAPNNQLLRLSSSGTIDTSFGSDGHALLLDRGTEPVLASGPHGTVHVAHSRSTDQSNSGAAAAPTLRRFINELARTTISVTQPAASSVVNTSASTTFGVTNAGPDTSWDTGVSITAGAAVSIDQVALPSGALCPLASNVATCSIGALTASGTPQLITVMSHSAAAGSSSLTAQLTSGTYDDGAGSGDTATSAVASTAPIAVVTRKATPKVTLRQIAGKRLVSCGTKLNQACTVRRIKRGVRPVAFTMRGASSVLPRASSRTVTFVVQRLIGKRWVTIRGFSSKLATNRTRIVNLPAAYRGASSTRLMRISLVLPATVTTNRAASAWLYVRPLASLPT